VLNDWGEDFTVLDKNGEEIPEMMVKTISNGEKGVVELVSKHLLEDGDQVLISDIVGMQSKSDVSKSINGTIHKVTVINKTSLSISDTTEFTPYERNGILRLVKTPIQVKFAPLKQILDVNNDLPFDELLLQSDFMKLDNPLFSHIAFLSAG
jgi:hypothetical protein